MNKFILTAFFGLFLTEVIAQDVLVYKSPHDLDKTISKLYFSIDKNGFSYINTLEYRGNPRNSGGVFKGMIKVISFETEHVSQLAACEPSAILEMPFKVLVWQQDDDTFIAYENASSWKQRYMILGCDELISKINKSFIRVVNDAVRTH